MEEWVRRGSGNTEFQSAFVISRDSRSVGSPVVMALMVPVIEIALSFAPPYLLADFRSSTLLNCTLVLARNYSSFLFSFHPCHSFTNSRAYPFTPGSRYCVTKSVFFGSGSGAAT